MNLTIEGSSCPSMDKQCASFDRHNSKCLHRTGTINFPCLIASTMCDASQLRFIIIKNCFRTWNDNRSGPVQQNRDGRWKIQQNRGQADSGKGEIESTIDNRKGNRINYINHEKENLVWPIKAGIIEKLSDFGKNVMTLWKLRRWRPGSAQK